MYRYLLAIAISISCISVQGQDLPGGTTQGGSQSVNNPEVVEHFRQIELLSGKALVKVNARAKKCLKASESFQNIVVLYDRLMALQAVESVELNSPKNKCNPKIRKCLLQDKTDAILNRIGKDPYFELYITVKFPNHAPIKSSEFLNFFEHD